MATQTKAVVNGIKPKQLKPIPKLSDLVNNEVVKSEENELQVFLNQEPPAKWVIDHPLYKNCRYLSVDKVEYLLTSIFISWWVEIIEWKQIANSTAVHIRLFYVSPITGQVLHQDGIGATPLQTDKNKGAAEFNFIKDNAVQISLPSAESLAIKDAAEKIGRVFGKDLNRKDLMAYEGLSGRYAPKTPDEIAENRMIGLIKDADSKTALAKLKINIKENWENAKIEYNSKLESLS
ncbi:MAG: hypothetical protein WAT16_00310 [Saprospiraceae bacterium]|nr:hypothetical protein [Saprospiraceae bacterium]